MTNQFKVGDYVDFKSDIEQTGKVIRIKRNSWGQRILVLEATSESGFSGDYIGGQQVTEVLEDDCWD